MSLMNDMKELSKKYFEIFLIPLVVLLKRGETILTEFKVKEESVVVLRSFLTMKEMQVTNQGHFQNIFSTLSSLLHLLSTSPPPPTITTGINFHYSLDIFNLKW